MSLATLKKKSQVLYNNLSVRQNGFSLNGSHRSAGYIGQSSQSRHLSRTLMKGNVVRGNGGCCGTYIVTNVPPSELACLNDPNVVKKSVANTEGMLHTKYAWFWSGKQSVKPDSNNNASQSDYTTRIAKQTINNVNNLNKLDTVPTVKIVHCNALPAFARPRNNSIVTTNIRQRTICPNTKPETVMTQQQYIQKLDANCTANDPNPVSYNCNCPIPGAGNV
jgi:hypothetical protein